MINAAYIFFSIIGIAIFAFGMVFEVAADLVVVIIAASVMAIPVMIERVSERIARQNRSAHLRASAERNGWPFDGSEQLDPQRTYANLPLFERGEARAVQNITHTAVTAGSRVIPVQMGDYDFRITLSNRNMHHEVSFLVARLPRGDLPKLIVRRERAFDRIKSAFGFDDIDFESKAFSDRFFVGSSDKRFAYRLITPRVMDFLMQGSGVQGPPTFYVGGEWVGVVSTSRRWSVSDFQAAHRWMEEFLSRWPDAVLTPHKPATRVHSAP
jgi:hypothetical protein